MDFSFRKNSYEKVIKSYWFRKNVKLKDERFFCFKEFTNLFLHEKGTNIEVSFITLNSNHFHSKECVTLTKLELENMYLEYLTFRGVDLNTKYTKGFLLCDYVKEKITKLAYAGVNVEDRVNFISYRIEEDIIIYSGATYDVVKTGYNSVEQTMFKRSIVVEYEQIEEIFQSYIEYLKEC